MIQYVRTMSILHVMETERHLYGIDALDGEGNILASAPAITDNWRLVSRMVGYMNELELSLVHFEEVLEDIRTETRLNSRSALLPEINSNEFQP